MHRNDERQSEYENRGATVLIGDAMDRDSIVDVTAQAATACDTVVNLIGGSPQQPASSWPDFSGNVNAIDAAAGAGIKRFIFITSVGTGSSLQYVPKDAFMRPMLKLKSRAEEHLRQCGLRYSIIKPGGLWHSEPVSSGDLPLITENDSVRGLIDRSQLVYVIKQVLADEAGLTDCKELFAVTYKLQVLSGEAIPFDFQKGKIND